MTKPVKKHINPDPESDAGKVGKLGLQAANDTPGFLAKYVRRGLAQDIKSDLHLLNLPINIGVEVAATSLIVTAESYAQFSNLTEDEAVDCLLKLVAQHIKLRRAELSGGAQMEAILAKSKAAAAAKRGG